MTPNTAVSRTSLPSLSPISLLGTCYSYHHPSLHSCNRTYRPVIAGRGDQSSIRCELDRINKLLVARQTHDCMFAVGRRGLSQGEIDLSLVLCGGVGVLNVSHLEGWCGGQHGERGKAATAQRGPCGSKKNGLLRRTGVVAFVLVDRVRGRVTGRRCRD